MQKLIVIIGLLCTTALMNAQDTYFQEYLEKWSNAKAYTIGVVELMPEAAFGFKPTEDEMTFQEQTLHLLRNMYWLSSSYLGKDTLAVDFKEFKGDKVALIQLMNEVFSFSENAVKKMTIAQLEEKVDFFAGPKSKRQILMLMNDHLTHHRAQMIVYLRLNGVKPPRYVGW